MCAKQWHGASSIVVLGAILGGGEASGRFCRTSIKFLTYRAELSTHFLGEIDVCVLAVQPVIAELAPSRNKRILDR